MFPCYLVLHFYFLNQCVNKLFLSKQANKWRLETGPSKRLCALKGLHQVWDNQHAEGLSLIWCTRNFWPNIPVQEPYIVRYRTDEKGLRCSNDTRKRMMPYQGRWYSFLIKPCTIERDSESYKRQLLLGVLPYPTWYSRAVALMEHQPQWEMYQGWYRGNFEGTMSQIRYPTNYGATAGMEH